MTRAVDWQIVVIASTWIEEVDCNSGARRRVYKDGSVVVIELDYRNRR